MIRQKVSGIYKIINITNNKYYIGSSYDIYYRWRKHKEKLNKNKHHSIKLQRSWNRDGKDSFKFIIIEKCDRSLLIEKEQNYLNIAQKNKKDSYNMTFDATRPENKYGYKHSSWVKVSKKVRNILKNYWLKHGTIKTLEFAKKQYNIGSKVICNRLIPIFKKQTTQRPKRKNTDKKIYSFYHKDGKIFTGTRRDFINKYNLIECCVCNMLCGRFLSHKGWYLTKQIPKTNRTGSKNSNYDNRIYTIYNIFTKEKITDTRYQIYTIHKILKKDIVGALINGKTKQTKDGWIIYSS